MFQTLICKNAYDIKVLYKKLLWNNFSNALKEHTKLFSLNNPSGLRTCLITFEYGFVFEDRIFVSIVSYRHHGVKISIWS